MSQLSEEDVHTLSRLCRLSLDGEEVIAITKDLQKILHYVEQLQEVDVTTLPPYSHLEEQGVGDLREDVVGETLSRDLFLKNAPEHTGGMIRVPPVLAKEG